jgi:hydroxypyruvate reductase
MVIMSNRKNVTELRKDASAIFQAGLEAVNAQTAVQRFLRWEDPRLSVGEQVYDLDRFENAYVVGAGKASAAMAQAIELLLADRLRAGILNVKYEHALPLDTVQVNEAGHPVPDEAGMLGTQRMIQLLQSTEEHDLIICLISGGGSALLPCPATGMTLADKQQVTQLLLDCGATIHEINTIRKHLSRIKGGRLAQLAYPSTLVSLILSDVIGDDLDSIASGPTVPDRSTFQDCWQILAKYGLEERIAESAKETLRQGVEGKIQETPKEGDSIFRKVQNLIVGSNILAVEAASRKADELGYCSLVLSTMIEGETREVARVHSAIAREILKSGHPVQPPACIISGGETTVTIRGKGLGGRNQEFALATALEIDGLREVVVLSGGTDGTDGPTDAAGAIADGETLQRAGKEGMEASQYLADNNSYPFFKSLGDLLVTGPTFTNVMDLRLLLVDAG